LQNSVSEQAASSGTATQRPASSSQVTVVHEASSSSHTTGSPGRQPVAASAPSAPGAHVSTPLQ
jgi:hypothetical protein